jgi:hypothetical protein
MLELDKLVQLVLTTLIVELLAILTRTITIALLLVVEAPPITTPSQQTTELEQQHL